MFISIVIRAYNEEKHIGRLLYGITQQTLSDDVEIILVDSGSTDGTLAVATQYPVRIEHITPDMFTFGRSLNRGIAASAGEIVVITSAHCYPVYPDWLEQLVKPFADENIALSYGKQRAGATNHFSEQQFFRKYFPDVSVPQQAQPYSHNANAAIRRSLWEEHPYNENLTGLEDLAWSSWARAAGYGIAYVAEAEVIHQHEETYRQVFKRYQREAIALKQILPQSTFSLGDLLASWVKYSLLDMRWARWQRILHQKLFPILRFRWQQYWGTYRGYHYSGQVDAQLHRAFYYPSYLLHDKAPQPRPVDPIPYKESD